MAKSLALKIFGRVQGVGFRYQAKITADSLGLVGWIRNSPDGSVEAEVEGSEDDLNKFLAWCYNGSKLARVDKIDYSWKTDLEHHHKFVII